MTDNDPLRRDVRLLGDMLGEVIVEHHGAEQLALAREIRELARARRANTVGAEAKLAERISNLTEAEIRVVTRSLSIFFDLSNLAEDRHRVRVLRTRELKTDPEPIGESIGAAIKQLKAAGFPPERVQAALDLLDIELVFTAHPSEAKRRSVRNKLRRMRKAVMELDRNDLLPRERKDWLARLKADMTVLWETEFLRPSRPTVMEEVERGLSIMPRLWEVVPTIFDALRRALSTYYPDHSFTPPSFLHFGSWIGGDRDGHPYVTADVTARTLLWLRDTAIDRHRERAQAAFDYLTIAANGNNAGHELLPKIAEAVERWPAYAETMSRVGPRETFRRWIKLIDWRLQQSRLTDLAAPPLAGAYSSGAELEADVAALCAALKVELGPSMQYTEIQRWHDLVRSFGLYLTKLDVRQDARRYRECMTEIFAQLGVAKNFGELDEGERQAILTRTLGNVDKLREGELGPLTQDTLKLFRLLFATTRRLGPEALGGHVISMTRYPSDVLTVLWLWTRAAREHDAKQTPADLKIIPLFEKIGDLKGAAGTLAAILDMPAYGDYLARQGKRQTVMVGYSDSTKDGGYLAACWGLYQAQDQLHGVAAQRGVRLTFFHGRGGSLGRGGGPAARGILSLPPQSIGGSLRLTEQGEVLAERYDDVDIAYRHLEQVTWATLVAGNIDPNPVKPEWTAWMEKVAERSFAVYRNLVDQPGFIEYFDEATPIEEIENLPIASRPSRRTGQRTLADLRAIPWVFAWTQNRCLIPAWYGLGAALSDIKYGDRAGWQTICEMYRQWPFFQASIDNAALALAKADMYIGQRYSELCEDADRRQRLWLLIAAERDRSRQAILEIVGGSELLASTPWFQGSIEVRNPSIDPLNLIQIELLRRRRAKPPAADGTEQDPLRDLLRLTVQGIAAGMRTTG